jgi:hypothetical protein
LVGGSEQAAANVKKTIAPSPVARGIRGEAIGIRREPEYSVIR